MIMVKTNNVRVSNPKPLTRKPFPGETRPGINPAIFFYKVEYNNNSDIGHDSVIHVKIDKSISYTK